MAELLSNFDSYYRDTGARQQQFRSFAIARLEPELTRIGWEAKPDEPTMVTNLRQQLIGVLASLDDQNVVNEARRRYAAQSTDPKAIPSALRKTIYAVVATHADAATWDQLHTQAQTEKTPLIKAGLYDMLASSEDEALAKRALDLSITDEPGATTSANMIDTVSRLHPDMAFDFVVAHREKVEKLVDGPSLSQYYPRVARMSLDPAMVGKLNDFANAHIAASARRNVNTAIANIQYRIGVRNQRLPAIDAWLKKNG
jgi:aminopeptidase N